MKMFSLIPATVLALALLSLPTHAEEPDTIKLTPELKAMLSQLLKATDAEGTDEQPKSLSSPSPESSEKSPKPKHTETTTSLKTGSLRTGSLATSASLGGHGTQGGAPRLTSDEWRQLFPLRR